MELSSFILESAPGGASFNNLINNILQFRSLPLASQLFHFFYQTIVPDDLTTGQKQTIIDFEFPWVSSQCKLFEHELSEFDQKLVEHRKKPDIEVPTVSNAYMKSIIELENLLEAESLKRFIIKEFENEIYYDYHKFGSMNVRGFKGEVWNEFKPETLEIEYLFDEYIEFLNNLKDHVAHAVFEYSNNYADPVMANDMDFFPSPKQKLKVLFDELKWDEFIERCNYYCELREFKRKKTGKIIYAKVISRSRQNGFKWEGIGGSKIPVLAEFMTQLFNESFFSLPRKRQDACLAFLKFFGLQTDESTQKQLCRDFQQINQYHLYFDYLDSIAKRE